MASGTSAMTAPDDPLRRELERIAGLDLAGLRSRWRRVFGRTAPASLPRVLLHRTLAYRLQAEALGDLDRETLRAIDRLADQDGASVPLPERAGTKPGTLLVREWQGELQRVMVLEQGYAWNGVTYDSLSRVARAITGTPWSGPRFFGLKGSMDRAGSQDQERPGS